MATVNHLVDRGSGRTAAASTVSTLQVRTLLDGRLQPLELIVRERTRALATR